jgi:tetratricopeptide (TPR) repeat protein
VLGPLAALALARALLAVAPGAWGWGLDLQRHLAPALGWSLWALSALALVPAVGDALARVAAPMGRPTRAGRPWATAGAALAAAALVLLLPDRTWFLGDFQLRQRAIEQGLFQAVLPMSLPLDGLLHYHLPRWMQERAGLPPALYARGLGALEAALLAALGAAFARLRMPAAGDGESAAAPWLALAVVVGPPLAVFTGFPKTTADLCVLTLAAVVLGVRLVRDGRGHLAFGLTLAAALLDHRAAVVLLPAAAYAWWRCRARRDGVARVAMAALPPLAALAAVAPRVRDIVVAYDVPVHFRPGAGAPALAGAAVRALETANAVLTAAPLVVLLPLLAWLPRRARRSADTRYLLLIAVSFVPVVLFVQPRQGLFRDWEVLAPAAVAFTALAAWTLGGLVAARQAAPRLAVAAALSALVPALTLLAHAHDVDRGLARARALLDGPPARTVDERAFLWDFIGERSLALGRWPDAAAAYEQVSRIEPSRGVLLSWGLAAAGAGDHASARRAFARMLERHPDDLAAWAGLGGAAEQSGDATTAVEARARLAAGARDPRVRAELRRLLRDAPRLGPALADSLERP